LAPLGIDRGVVVTAHAVLCFEVQGRAREIKNVDEIALLNRAAAMVDGAYDLVNEKLRPGVRENDFVAEVNKFLYTHGSDDVEAINAISGERCNPQPNGDRIKAGPLLGIDTSLQVEPKTRLLA
jgi:Xaa-Pro aminopeptidase